jgi:dTDP-4-amino-4,6-dideoxygalactose transaminase
MPIRKLPRRGIHRAPGTRRAVLLGTPRGPRAVRALEELTASTLGVPSVVAVGSGRKGLELLLRALNLPEGSEVLLPALTFHAVPTAVERAGLRPVFVDVDPATLLLDPTALARAVTLRSSAVLATWLAGLMSDPAPLRRVCEANGLVLLEDFAQAAGAGWGQRAAGSLGLAGLTSLETVKPLAGFGGGLISCSDDALAERLRTLRARLVPPDLRRLASKVLLAQLEGLLANPTGFSLAWPLFSRDSKGGVARYKARKQSAGNHMATLHPLQARAAMASLANLEAHLAQRRERAAIMRAALPPGCWWPAVPPRANPSWYQVLVRCADLDAAGSAARTAGLDLGTGVVKDLSAGACPHAARAARELVQLPCHTDLGPADIARVAETVGPWLV